VASVFSALVWPCPCRRRRCASQVTAPCWPSPGDISGTACPIYCRRKWQHPVRPAHPSLMPHPSAAASSVLLLAITSIPNQFRNCCKLQLLEWTDVTKYIDPVYDKFMVQSLMQVNSCFSGLMQVNALCGFMWEIERRSQRVAIRVFALCELIVGMYDSMWSWSCMNSWGVWIFRTNFGWCDL
jgi:hypothetical protein